MAKIQNPTKVITGVNTRWSYANVWDAKSINGGAPKYSVSLIIPKSDTVTVNKIKAAIEAAYEEGQSKLKGNGKTVPALTILKTPLRDGDLERPDDPAYANAYFINANRVQAFKNKLWVIIIVQCYVDNLKTTNRIKKLVNCDFLLLDTVVKIIIVRCKI